MSAHGAPGAERGRGSRVTEQGWSTGTNPGALGLLRVGSGEPVEPWSCLECATGAWHLGKPQSRGGRGFWAAQWKCPCLQME